MDTTTIPVQPPIELVLQAESLVESGWFEDVNDLIVDALRRYLEGRRPALMESHIWQDVGWGRVLRYGKSSICPNKQNCHQMAAVHIDSQSSGPKFLPDRHR
jgi:hypothetical protein